MTDLTAQSATCPICLEQLSAQIVHSTCCMVAICHSCDADFKLNATTLVCPLCHLNMLPAENSAEHPAIQAALRGQVEGLLTALTNYSQLLQQALDRLQLNQNNCLANMLELKQQIGQLLARLQLTWPESLPTPQSNCTESASVAFQQHLERFYANDTKANQLESTELINQQNSTTVRINHLTALVKAAQLPLILIVLSQDWHQSITNQISQLNAVATKTYLPRVWWRHPQAMRATQLSKGAVTGHYSMRISHATATAEDLQGLIIYRNVSHIVADYGWAAVNCFLDTKGHVVLFNRTNRVDGGYLTVELMDLTMDDPTNYQPQQRCEPTGLWTLAWANEDIYTIDSVVALAQGYLLVTIHSDSLEGTRGRQPIYFSQRKLVLIYVDATGQQQWSHTVTSTNLATVQVYANQVFVFGDTVEIWRLDSSHDSVTGLTLISSRPVRGVKPGYRSLWLDNNLLYFSNRSQDGIIEEARYYYFDLASPQSGNSVVLTEITTNQVFAKSGITNSVIPGLKGYRPLSLPGLMLYWTEVADWGYRYKIANNQRQCLLTGTIVPLTDYYGLLYQLITVNENNAP